MTLFGKTTRIALTAASSIVVINLTMPAKAQSDGSGPSSMMVMPPLPPQTMVPDEREFIPPSTNLIHRSNDAVCDENDIRTTAELCRIAIKNETQELAWMHHIVDAGLVNRGSSKGQARVRYFKQKLAHDNRVLRFIQLHPRRS